MTDFLFNYHATIINQLFNHHFSRFTRNRYTPKCVKNGMFSGKHKPFLPKHVTFCKKDVRFFPQNARIRAIYTSI